MDFYFVPHLNSEDFEGVRRENIERAAVGMSKPVYVLDDESALKVVDGKVEVVGGGEWFVVDEGE